MDLLRETTELQAHLRCLAAEADLSFLERYALRPLPWRQLSPFRRFRAFVGAVLRRCGLWPPAPEEPWLAGLKQAPLDGDGGEPLVIWALGSGRETLRTACRAFQSRIPASRYAVVLIADVADFAFFSRLDWLVEFVPALSAPGSEYAERKLRHLAWRYRDALVLPLSAGFSNADEIEELLNA